MQNQISGLKRRELTSVRIRAAILIISVVIMGAVFAVVTGMYIGNREISKSAAYSGSESPVSGIMIAFSVSGLVFLACGIAASVFLSKIYRKPYKELHRCYEELAILREKTDNINKARTDFLASISHEMRTPMNVLVGMASIGKSAKTIDEKNYAFNKIDSASKHLMSVINNVFDMSKIEANNLELSPANFNIENLLQKVANFINFRVDERRQKIYITIDNKIPHTLIGDEQRLAQVIINLLTNAVKFTPAEGTIHLRTDMISNENDTHKGICRLRISVMDTGIGITSEQKAHLFESLEQTETGALRKFGSTGLGLVISKRIVEMMDGMIWAESEPGHGSTFIFTVTVRCNAGEPKRLLAEGVDPGALRIFVADDDPEICKFFKNMFANLGIPCTVAASGKEAAGLLALENNYDVYFINWMMPDISGIELTRQINEKKIRVRDPRKSIAVIFSSTDWGVVKNNVHAAGVEKLLPKPLFMSNIIYFINECIGYKNQAGNTPEEKVYDNYSGHTILFAEDIEINREIVQKLLEPTNIIVEGVEDGIKALTRFSEAPDKYDIIFMDVQMPEMDGYKTTQCIRAFEAELRAKKDSRISGRPGGVPIIAMTANVFNEDIEKCLEAGMNDHIGKPVDPDKLLATIKTYIQPPL